MNQIKTKFERNGFCFEQIKRVGDVAIYGQSRPKSTQPSHYEVVQIRRRESREAFGKQFEAGEFYPSSEEWGRFGWTYPDLASAEARLRVLTRPN